MSRHEVSRREFLRWTGAAGLGLVTPSALDWRALTFPLPQARPPVGDPWTQVDAILARIAAPVFPDRDFDVMKYGASGDGAKDCTAAFREAVAACAAAGGGRVIVPAGRFLTGAVHLRSRVNLHLAEGSTLAFSRDPRQFLPAVFTRWEGVEVMNYSPFIYAFEARDVAITGSGTLDGEAGDAHWWP